MNKDSKLPKRYIQKKKSLEKLKRKLEEEEMLYKLTRPPYFGTLKSETTWEDLNTHDCYQCLHLHTCLSEYLNRKRQEKEKLIRRIRSINRMRSA